MSSKGMREGSKHESAVDGREVGRSEGAKQPSQDTKKLLFKTDEGRNGAASIIFIYVEITEQAGKMTHGGWGWWGQWRVATSKK